MGIYCIGVHYGTGNGDADRGRRSYRRFGYRWQTDCFDSYDGRWLSFQSTHPRPSSTWAAVHAMRSGRYSMSVSFLQALASLALHPDETIGGDGEGTDRILVPRQPIKLGWETMDRRGSVTVACVWSRWTKPNCWILRHRFGIQSRVDAFLE